MRFNKNALLAGVVMIVAISLYQLAKTDQKQKPEIPKLTSSVSLDAKFAKCQFAAAFDFSDPDPGKPVAPMFNNLGDYHFEITTSSPEAQNYFDQGIRLVYAFNHAEAHRSFREAARLDPEMAMAYWGQALALGPNINDPLPDEERTQKAYEAASKALELAGKSSKMEKALITALQTRQDKDPTMDRHELNVRYSEAMKPVREKYGEHPDILTLYGAAVMNTMPWNYWTNDGKPNPGTLDAKEALEKAMTLEPDHPGAHHYYIHMVELPDPDLAVPSADRLLHLMPGAGHLVHMPAHIYIRVGKYKEARIANVLAIDADEDYISQCLSQGLYPLAYYPHNIHFLWSAASWEGNSEIAMDAAHKTASRVPRDQIEAMPFTQDFLSTPLLAQVRFGKWNEILSTPYPGNDLKHVRMVWHYARGLAFVAKGEISEAQEELEALQELAKDPELENLLANYTNPTSAVIPVAIYVLSGEMAAAQGEVAKAQGLFEEGVAHEDQLVYSEPPAWHVPVRQNLGAMLVKFGKAKEAQKVFEADLKKNRDNGWSLLGLYQSYLMQGDHQKAQEAKEKFEAAWSEADVTLTAAKY